MDPMFDRFLMYSIDDRNYFSGLFSVFRKIQGQTVQLLKRPLFLQLVKIVEMNQSPIVKHSEGLFEQIGDIAVA